MTTTPEPDRASNRRRRYFLDDASQSTVLAHVLALLAAACAGGAATAVVLARTELGGDAFSRALPVLLAAQAGCFVVAGLISIPVVMRLTHRYVGPALVMRRALAGMRQGDYGCRLNLRRRDYLKGLAQEIDAHRSLIARRDVGQARLLNALRLSIEEGDLDGARALLRVQGRRLELQPSGPTRTPSQAAADAQAAGA